MAEAIGYPDRMSEGTLMATLRVDGAEVAATVTGERIVLSQSLTDDADKLPALAGYAAGRMLKEEAVLSYGDGTAFLWQDASARASDQALARLFESFMDSCDWWRSRVTDLDSEEGPGVHEIVIRP